MFRRFGLSLAVSLLVLTGAAPAFADSHPVPAPSSSADGSGSTGTSGTVQPEPPSTVRPEARGVYAENVRVLVDGHETEAIPPGREVTLLIGLRNSGTETVKAAKLIVSEGATGVRIVDGTDDLGDIAAGALVDGKITVVVDKADCQDFIGIAGEVTSGDETFPLKIGAPVACPGPRLQIESYRFIDGDGDQTPEPGEKLSLTVTIRNDGRDPARALTGTLTFGDGFTVLVGSSRWGDIAPQASATNITPFVIEVDRDTKIQTTCPAGEPVVVDGGPGIVTDGGNTGSGSVASDQPATEPSTDKPTTSSGDTPVSSAPDETRIPPDGNVKTMPYPAVPSGDPGVAFDATLILGHADGDATLTFSNRMMCAFAEGGKGIGAPDDAAQAAYASQRTASVAASRGAWPIVAILLTVLAVAGLRFVLKRRHALTSSRIS